MINNRARTKFVNMTGINIKVISDAGTTKQIPATGPVLEPVIKKRRVRSIQVNAGDAPVTLRVFDASTLPDKKSNTIYIVPEEMLPYALYREDIVSVDRDTVVKQTDKWITVKGFSK